MAAAVTLTRVAQLENRATSSRFREKGRKRREDSRERSGRREELRQRPGARNARVLSAISIYFASNLHVSPRVSALFRAQHSCGTPSTPLPLVLSRSPLVSLLFFLYIVARTVGELTRNPLVASTHHPPTTTVSRPNTPPRRCSSPWISLESATENYEPLVEVHGPASDSRLFVCTSSG